MQKETLLSFLKLQAGSTFSQDHKLSDVKSVEEFRARQKLTTYNDYKDYMEAVASGDDMTAVTSPQPLLLAPTSGTTSGVLVQLPSGSSASRKYTLWFNT